MIQHLVEDFHVMLLVENDTFQYFYDVGVFNCFRLSGVFMDCSQFAIEGVLNEIPNSLGILVIQREAGRQPLFVF